MSKLGGLCRKRPPRQTTTDDLLLSCSRLRPRLSGHSLQREKIRERERGDFGGKSGFCLHKPFDEVEHRLISRDGDAMNRYR